MTEQLIADDVCTLEEATPDNGMILEMPKGFRVHLDLTDEGDFEFRGWPEDAKPTLERMYPHLMAAAEVGYPTKKAAIAAARKAALRERKKPE